MARIDTLRCEIRRAYKRQKKTGRGGWREVGHAFGITEGMAFRIAEEEGYEPKGAHVRARLGLPAMVPAPACERCGEVHVKKRCSKGRTPSARILWGWPVEMLRKAFEEREEMK